MTTKLVLSPGLPCASTTRRGIRSIISTVTLLGGGSLGWAETSAPREVNSILTRKVPSGLSPLLLLMPRNNRPARGDVQVLLAPTRNGLAASLDPMRPIRAPGPASLTGYVLIKSRKPRLAPAAVTEVVFFPETVFKVPVAVIVNLSPGRRSSLVSTQASL